MTVLPTIDVIVVNYCTGSLVMACLESLADERERLDGLRAIVVDNQSPDGSGAMLAEAVEARGWTDWVTLIRSPDNRGFGAGNNIGIAAALSRRNPADLIWMLNPDTRTLPGAGVALSHFMAMHPMAGIAGSALLEGDGRAWPFAFRFPTVLGEIERGARWGILTRVLQKSAVLRRMGDGAEQVDWVSGASFVVRRGLLEMGLRFDETFFLYYEETDFCLNARRAGWECWYVPDAVVLHIAGQSTGVTGRQVVLRRLPAYWFKSRQHYFLKNHGRAYGMLADIGWMAGHLFACAKSMLGGAPGSNPPRLFSDFIRHSAFMPRWLARGLNHARGG